MRRSVWLGAALAAVLGQASCSETICGPGTVSRFNPDTGNQECVLPDAIKGVQCDPATASQVGGVCTGDPNKFPSCGPGTMLDTGTNSCVPTGSTEPLPKPCDAMQPMGKFCVNGVIRYLKDNTVAKGVTLEVRAVNPIDFLFNPQTPPQQTVTTSDGTYTMNGLADQSGMGLIAFGTTDPGSSVYMLTGAGLDMVGAGGKYRVDLYVVEKSLVAMWDQQAGLSGTETFEEKGAYLAKFIDKPRGQEASAKPVAGVVLTMMGAKAADQYFFKGNLSTIDTSLMATDAMTGAAVQRVIPMALTNYSGMASGGLLFETLPGGSLKGVVFVATFHTKM